MLKDIPTNQRKQALRCKGCTHCIQGLDGDGQANNFNLNRVDILSSGDVRGRRNIYNVYNRQLKLFCRSIVNASRCCTSVNKRHARHWLRQSLSLLKKLVCDALCKPNGDLNTRSLTLHSGWDFDNLTLRRFGLPSKLSV